MLEIFDLLKRAAASIRVARPAGDRSPGERPPADVDLAAMYPGVITADARQLFDSFCADASTMVERRDALDAEAARAILDSEPAVRIQVLLLALAQLRTFATNLTPTDRETALERMRRYRAADHLATALLRQKLPFEPAQMGLMIEQATNLTDSHIRPIVRIAGAHYSEPGMQDVIREGLTRLRAWCAGAVTYYSKVIVEIDAILRAPTDLPVQPGEPLGEAIAAFVKEAGAAAPAWTNLIVHAADCDASKPAKKWLDRAMALIDDVGRPEFVAQVERWKAAFTAFDMRGLLNAHGWLSTSDQTVLLDRNYSVMKGLVWALRLVEDATAANLIGDIGVAAYVKTPAIGARSMKVGNAAVDSLGAMREMAAVAQLSRLKRKVKYAHAQDAIEKAFAAAAARAGMSPADIEEIATPTFGLDADGWLRDQIGEYTLQMPAGLTGFGDPQWTDKDGKTTKSIPAAAQRENAEEISALKRAEKDLKNILPALVSRIESTYLAQRTWSMADWRDRYLDHPLMGIITRTLIWHFTDGERKTQAHWHDGALVDVAGNPIAWLHEGDNVTVQLWHPIGFEAETVLAWRRRIEDLGIVQPFKQAHREVYILTDAELATETYSNRFAAHIIRQHQFAQLLRQRGWSYRLEGQFDNGGGYPTWSRPDLGYFAEFWTMAAGEDASENGIFLYLSTDQVRFYRYQGTGPMALSDVPAHIFTEVMRDVDLFVGVCSVGNDPAWADHGHDDHGYWLSYSFGDLTAMAATRYDILSRLLPRLKIADRCTLDGKFLKVRGDIRTYKIHLGSANILMEPNDQYLCIVPDRKGQSKSEGVFLPFEGDTTLSIILSKAFLLAADTRITDSSIVSQIKGRRAV